MHLHISIEDLLRSVDPLLAGSRSNGTPLPALNWFRPVVESRHCCERCGILSQAACPGVIGLQRQALA